MFGFGSFTGSSQGGNVPSNGATGISSVQNSGIFDSEEFAPSVFFNVISHNHNAAVEHRKSQGGFLKRFEHGGIGRILGLTHVLPDVGIIDDELGSNIANTSSNPQDAKVGSLLLLSSGFLGNTDRNRNIVPRK